MVENPKISIIVPVYNVEPYIRKCIDSILVQTFQDFELILIDDGSPDNCGKICDEYAALDNRIVVIHKENGGLSSARNAGLDLAKGEYISFIDSDDYIDRQMYDILYQQAKTSQSDMVVCGFHMVDEDDHILNNLNMARESSTEEYSNIEALYEMFHIEKEFHTGTEVNPKWIIMCNKLYRRDLFKGLRFPEGRIYEDEYIAHHLLYRCKKITCIPERLYFYLQRENTLSNFAFNTKKFDRLYALKQRADFFKKIGLMDLHYKTLKGFMDSFFWNYSLAKATLPNAKSELKKLKKTMNQSHISFLRSPLISWKQKVFITLFIIYPAILDITAKKQAKVQKG
jgi:glycosyltransferase involved in cell wall biosynthesis